LVFKVAARNFTRNARRFLLLGAAVASGFFIICIIQSLVAGVTDQINERGARFYGGNLVVLGYQKHPVERAMIGDDRPVLEAIKASGIKPVIVSHRTHEQDGVVFFNGEKLRMRRIIGLDWADEAPSIRRMEFVSGDPENMSDPRRVLISEVVAKRLGAKVGDEILLEIQRGSGAIDTKSLIVAAVFREASIFGYFTLYMDRRTLNGVLGIGAEDCSLIGLYLNDYRQADQASARLREALKDRVSVFPPLERRDDFNAARAADFHGIRYGPMTIRGFLSEIGTMLEALSMVSWAILALVIIVVTVGIMNIYRVMIYERTREIGTMRAIGVKRAQVRNLILTEALMLSVCSIAVGLGLSALALSFASSFQLGVGAGFDIFLDRGHLSWVINADVTAIDAALIALVTLFGALGPAQAAQAIEPAVALRSD
jgi:ABC-type lipoprotein release transport system permease subunit